MKSFYCYLPSNSSINFFPENAISSYRVKLRQPLNLDGRFEVALTEISVPTEFSNVDEQHGRLAINTDGKSWRELGVPIGYYEDNDTFMTRLSSVLENARSTPGTDGTILQYIPRVRKAFFRIPAGISIHLYEGIAQILGFDGVKTLHGGRTHEAPHHADVFHNTYTLYVYLDCIAPQIVGDSEVQLLRTIHFGSYSAKNTQRVLTHIYQTPNYVPVNKQYLDTIKIDIRDSSGKKIPFLAGHSLCKLHFRQVSPRLVP